MSTIVRMAQGSPEWHEHRRKYRNASESPVVMGVSPFQTPYQLWQVKLGLVEPVVTPAMMHGSELEPLARAAYERQTGRIMQPLVVVDGEYSGSLDGMTLGGERIVEIKCPVRGKDSTLWKTVSAGGLPTHYQWQVEHQLMVTKAARADVFVFDGTDGILLEVAPDASTWPRIHEAWDKFAAFVASKSAPPLSKGDVRERSDREWIAAAAHYLETKVLAEQAQRASSARWTASTRRGPRRAPAAFARRISPRCGDSFRCLRLPSNAYRWRASRARSSRCISATMRASAC